VRERERERERKREREIGFITMEKRVSDTNMVPLHCNGHNRWKQNIIISTYSSVSCYILICPHTFTPSSSYYYYYYYLEKENSDSYLLSK